ncbi:hypothetical protein P3T18_001222 [Paraburkholderia sp. GAS199]|uniref:hypothetical protein n=1 Tax=Paraburkholderia sp. GAS199 TaxID=3035126 RepID=UPI003D231B99
MHANFRGNDYIEVHAMTQKADVLQRPFVVYGLFTLTQEGEKQYFYVGKTERSVEVRLREHVVKSAHGHENVYEHLRRLELANETWAAEVLRHCVGTEYREDAERFEVIQLLRQGHDLQNMRYGDAKQREEMKRQAADPTIRSLEDVTAARLFAKAFGPRKRQRRLKTRELRRMLREEGIPSVRECLLLSRVTRRRLLDGQNDVSIARGIPLEEIVKTVRSPQKKFDDVLDLIRLR